MDDIRETHASERYSVMTSAVSYDYMRHLEEDDAWIRHEAGSRAAAADSSAARTSDVTK